jgi:hypothetical protein
VVRNIFTAGDLEVAERGTAFSKSRSLRLGANKRHRREILNGLINEYSQVA